MNSYERTPPLTEKSNGTSRPNETTAAEYWVWLRWPWSHTWGVAFTGSDEAEARKKVDVRLKQALGIVEILVLPAGLDGIDIFFGNIPCSP